MQCLICGLSFTVLYNTSTVLSNERAIKLPIIYDEDKINMRQTIDSKFKYSHNKVIKTSILSSLDSYYQRH